MLSNTIIRQDISDFFLVRENFNFIELKAEMTIPQALYYKELMMRNIDFFLSLE